MASENRTPPVECSRPDGTVKPTRGSAAAACSRGSNHLKRNTRHRRDQSTSRSFLNCKSKCPARSHDGALLNVILGKELSVTTKTERKPKSIQTMSAEIPSESESDLPPELRSTCERLKKFFSDGRSFLLRRYE